MCITVTKRNALEHPCILCLMLRRNGTMLFTTLRRDILARDRAIRHKVILDLATQLRSSSKVTLKLAKNKRIRRVQQTPNMKESCAIPINWLCKVWECVTLFYWLLRQISKG
jgi:hypothetical protein